MGELVADGKGYEADILGNAVVYDDISKQPHRKTCALLPWIGIGKIVGDEVVGNGYKVCENGPVDLPAASSGE